MSAKKTELCVFFNAEVHAVSLVWVFSFFFLTAGGPLSRDPEGVFSFSFFFSLAKEEYNQSFVFRKLCNILEQDIGVSRDLVKNNKG